MEAVQIQLYRGHLPVQIEQVFAAPQHKPAKCLKVPGGTLYCRAAKEAQDAFVARFVGADGYDKGFIVQNDRTGPVN